VSRCENMSVTERSRLRHSRQQGARNRGRKSDKVEKVLVRVITGDHLKCCNEFKYLGTTVTADGLASREINLRRGRATVVFSALRKIWKSKSVDLKLKMGLYNSLVLSVLLYNSECLALRNADFERLEGFHSRCLQKMEVKGSLSIKNIIRKRRLQWVGHLMRLSENDPARRALVGGLEKYESRGASQGVGKDAWNQQMLEDLKSLNGCQRKKVAEILKMAKDRAKWSGLVQKATSSSNSLRPDVQKQRASARR